jgi:hypothetical protein
MAKHVSKTLGGSGGGGGGAFGKVREMIAKKKAEREAAQSQGQAPDVAEAAGEEMAAADAGGEGAVPQHGPEAHTGGAGPQGGIKKIGKVKMPGSGFMGNLFSDIRLKENITNTGISKSGIPTYEFNYIGCSNRYSGAMAQDLLSINPDAVSLDSSGYYKVNYDNIDVDMHLIN